MLVNFHFYTFLSFISSNSFISFFNFHILKFSYFRIIISVRHFDKLSDRVGTLSHQIINQWENSYSGGSNSE